VTIAAPEATLMLLATVRLHAGRAASRSPAIPLIEAIKAALPAPIPASTLFGCGCTPRRPAAGSRRRAGYRDGRAYIRRRNRRAQPKTNVAPNSKIRRPEYPIEAA